MASENEIDVKITADASGLNRGVLTANTALKELKEQLASTSSSGAATNIAAAGSAMEQFSLQTVGAKREVVVLGHELMTGNFSRVPGSLLVLAERMGGIQLATLGWVGAIAAASYGLYEMVSGVEKTAEAMDLIDNRLALTGRSYLQNNDQINGLINTLRQIPGVSESSAQAMVGELAGSARITSSEMTFLTQNVGKFAQMSGQTVPSAMKELATAIEDPFTGYKKLDNQYDILTVKQKQQIIDFEQTGDKAGAAGVLVDALGTRLETLTTKFTPLQTAAHDLRTAWDELLDSFGNSSSIKWLDEKGLPDLIGGLAKAADYLKYIYTAPAGTTFEQFKQMAKDAETVSKFPLKKDEQQTKQQNEAEGKQQKQQKAKDELKDHPKPVKSDEGQQRAVYAENYAVKKAFDEEMVASGKITLSQELADLRSTLDSEQELTNASFERQMAAYKKDSTEYKKLQDEKQIATAKYQIEVSKLNRKADEESNKSWTKAFNTIEHSFDQMTTGILRGTQTIGQAFKSMAGNLVIASLNATSKIALDWVKKEAQMLLATEAGEQAKVASKTAGVAEAKVIDDAAASSTIMKDAYKSAAGAYSAIVGIPYVGPILAPIAAGVAFAAVSAFDSFDVGTPYVQKDMLAKIHEGERIVPADENRNLSSGRNAGLGGGGEVHLHVHALDHKDVKRYLSQNKHIVAGAVGQSLRGGNRSALGR